MDTPPEENQADLVEVSKSEGKTRSKKTSYAEPDPNTSLATAGIEDAAKAKKTTFLDLLETRQSMLEEDVELTVEGQESDEEPEYTENVTEIFQLICAVQGISRFFTGFTLPESDVLSTFMKILHPRKDGVVINYNRESEWFGVVCKGSLTKGMGGEKIGMFKAGDMIGDAELFTRTHFKFSVTNNSERTLILVLRYETFASINHEYPDLGLKLYQVCGRAASVGLRRDKLMALGEEQFINNTNSIAATEALNKDLRRLHLKTKCFGAQFTEFDLGTVIENMYFRNVKEGSQLFFKGQMAMYVLLVMKGSVVGKINGMKSRTVFTARPGDFAGQEEFILSFFDETFLSSRVHDVFAVEDCVTAVLSKPMWEKMNEENPSVAWKLLRRMTAVTVLDLMKKRNLAFKFDHETMRRKKTFSNDWQQDISTEEETSSEDESDREDDKPLPEEEEEPIQLGKTPTETFMFMHKLTMWRNRKKQLMEGSEIEDHDDVPKKRRASDKVLRATAKFKTATKMLMHQFRLKHAAEYEEKMLNSSINTDVQKTKKQLMGLYNMGFLFGKVEDELTVTPQEVYELMVYASGYSQYWRGFLSGEMKVLAKIMILQRIREGEKILVAGETATFFGLILSGSVKMYDAKNDITRVFEKGALVGSYGIILGGIRFTDIIAEEECILGIFEYQDAIDLNESCPELGSKVFQILTYAAVHELRIQVSGIPETERLRIPPPGSDLMASGSAGKIADILGQVVIGKRMHLKKVKQMAEYLSPPIVFKEKDLILRRGQLSHGVLIVLDGEVSAKVDQLDSKTIMTAKMGAVVGEMGLLQGGEAHTCNLMRLTNVYATSETATITVLTFERLSNLNTLNPGLARDIFLRIVQKFIKALQSDVDEQHQERVGGGSLQITSFMRKSDAKGVDKDEARGLGGGGGGNGPAALAGVAAAASMAGKARRHSAESHQKRVRRKGISRAADVKQAQKAFKKSRRSLRESSDESSSSEDDSKEKKSPRRKTGSRKSTWKTALESTSSAVSASAKFKRVASSSEHKTRSSLEKSPTQKRGSAHLERSETRPRETSPKNSKWAKGGILRRSLDKMKPGAARSYEADEHLGNQKSKEQVAVEPEPETPQAPTQEQEELEQAGDQDDNTSPNFQAPESQGLAATTPMTKSHRKERQVHSRYLDSIYLKDSQRYPSGRLEEVPSTDDLGRTASGRKDSMSSTPEMLTAAAAFPLDASLRSSMRTRSSLTSSLGVQDTRVGGGGVRRMPRASGRCFSARSATTASVPRHYEYVMEASGEQEEEEEERITKPERVKVAQSRPLSGLFPVNKSSASSPRGGGFQQLAQRDSAGAAGYHTPGRGFLSASAGPSLLAQGSPRGTPRSSLANSLRLSADFMTATNAVDASSAREQYYSGQAWRFMEAELQGQPYQFLSGDKFMGQSFTRPHSSREGGGGQGAAAGGTATRQAPHQSRQHVRAQSASSVTPAKGGSALSAAFAQHMLLKAEHQHHQQQEAQSGPTQGRRAASTNPSPQASRPASAQQSSNLRASVEPVWNGQGWVQYSSPSPAPQPLQQQQRQPGSSGTQTATPSASRPNSTRPNSSTRPASTRPTSTRPASTQPVSARPWSTRPASTQPTSTRLNGAAQQQRPASSFSLRNCAGTRRKDAPIPPRAMSANPGRGNDQRHSLSCITADPLMLKYDRQHCTNIRPKSPYVQRTWLRPNTARTVLNTSLREIPEPETDYVYHRPNVTYVNSSGNLSYNHPTPAHLQKAFIPEEMYCEPPSSDIPPESIALQSSHKKLPRGTKVSTLVSFAVEDQEVASITARSDLVGEEHIEGHLGGDVEDNDNVLRDEDDTLEEELVRTSSRRSKHKKTRAATARGSRTKSPPNLAKRPESGRELESPLQENRSALFEPAEVNKVMYEKANWKSRPDIMTWEQYQPPNYKEMRERSDTPKYPPRQYSPTRLL